MAHSMGGLVASDALFSILDAHASNDSEDNQYLFPLVQGILAFDTPYNGLARSMFVYGGFSQYQKVSSVWNIMSASAAGLLSVRSLGQAGRMASKTASSSAGSLRKTPSWALWQAVAIRSGTVGAIAAGGVAAYIHREKIIKAVKSVPNLNKETIKEGYNQSYDAIGQGLAYINRDAVGQSFAWLSSHLKFVGALMQQKEMNKRLERLAGLKGIGVKNIYTSMGENGKWSGGYFVPERTFCAIPAKNSNAETMFVRNVNTLADDEIKAHMSMFRREYNDGYEKMSLEARDLIKQWFEDDAAVEDTAPYAVSSEEKETVTTAEGDEIPRIDEASEEVEAATEDGSPIDIVAVAASVPLPEGDDEDDKLPTKQTYIRSLMRIANNAGTLAGTGLSSASSGVWSAGSGLTSMIGRKRKATDVIDAERADREVDAPSTLKTAMSVDVLVSADDDMVVDSHEAADVPLPTDQAEEL